MKIQYLSIFIATLACAALFGCAKKAQEKPAAKIPTVIVATPAVADVEIKNTYSAKAVANAQTQVRARIGGYLEKVVFPRGAKVKKGDLLFRIDDRPYAAALAAAQAAVKAAESNLQLAQSNAERARGLLRKNAISTEGYQTRETALLLAQSKLLEAKAAEQNARLNMQYTRITAPVSGTLGETLVDEGNLIAAHATNLATVVDSSKMKIYYELGGADVLRYRDAGLFEAIDNGAGASAEFCAKGDSKKIKATLRYYDNALGTTTASLLLYAEADNPDAALLSGTYGDLTVLEGVQKNALLIPEDAIGTDMTGRFVYVVDKTDTVREIPVVLGAKVGALRVVGGALCKDSRVIVKGIQRAKAGAKVAPQTQAAAAEQK